MKLTVFYDADGTKIKVIRGYSISSQLFHDTRGSALVEVFNKKGKLKRAYHFGRAYSMEKEL